MEEVRSGRIPFCKLDVLHRRNLERILPRFGISGLAERRCATSIWPGIASMPGPTCRRAGAAEATLLARAGLQRQHLADGRPGAPQRLPWDAILGSEVAGDYKPKPRVYLAACEAFDLPPADCMMVAAHSNDLPQRRAAACARRTSRGRTNMARARAKPAPKVPVDVSARQPRRLGDEAECVKRGVTWRSSSQRPSPPSSIFRFRS